MLLVRIGLAARRLGVSIQTLRRWDESGRLTAVRTLGGHRRYDVRWLRAFYEGCSELEQHEPGDRTEPRRIIERAVTYTRVSSHRQAKAGDLDRQKRDLAEYCRHRGHVVGAELHDIASGINDARPNLLRLVRLVRAGSCEVVVIRDADRLARFGTQLLRSIMDDEGVRLEIASEETKDTAPETRLVRDVIALMTSFAGNLHRARRGRRIAAG